jgi:hypothetical protein
MIFKIYLSFLLLSSTSCYSMDKEDEFCLSSTVPSHFASSQENQTDLSIEDQAEYIDSSMESLLEKLERGEPNIEEEFTKLIRASMEGAISCPTLKDQEVFLKYFIYNDRFFKFINNTKFSDITSPYFSVLVNTMASFAESTTINPLIRVHIANAIAHIYSSILPKGGLPLDDLHIQGRLKWTDYIIDIQEEFGLLDPDLYEVSCNDAKGIYERLAKNAFPDIPTDLNNPYIQKAKLYAQKNALAFLKAANHLSYSQVSKSLSKFALMQAVYHSKNTTLQDQYVQDTIRAFEQCFEFSSNPPHKMMSIVYTESAPLNEEPIKELREDDEQDLLGNKVEMWNRGEKIASERDADQAAATLGWLYHDIPQAHGKEPNYKKAAQWFLSCGNKSYNGVREALKLPELQPYISR